MACILQMTFSKNFLELKFLYLDSSFMEICSQGSNQLYDSIGLSDSLVLNRQKVII